jgi:pyrroline-5-carboxylate reductase
MIFGIIGAGNMGGAIIKGYAEVLKTEGRKDSEILVFDANKDLLEKRASVDNVSAASSLQNLVERSDYLVFAIKPQGFEGLMTEVAAAVKAAPKSRVYVSIAAGITIAFMKKYLGEGSKYIRIMPNTPAMVGVGMAGIARTDAVTDDEFAVVMSIFNSFGRAVEVTEEEIHQVIGISGSSPAYAYMYIQALIEWAMEHGFTEEDARVFAAQSTMGAAKMVMENTDVSPEQLRINVCSPGGTTIEAVNVLLDEGFIETVKKAAEAAYRKSISMSK